MRGLVRVGAIAMGSCLAIYAAAQQAPPKPLAEKAIKVADGVWFERHLDVPSFGSNVSWFELGDYVVVVDTAFPLGAENALRSIKATTGGKPIRYVVVTHYHADHSFGAGVFAKEGATVIAHENARRDYVARNLAAYAKRATTDKVAAKYKAYAPNLTFSDKMMLEGGGRRAELYHFGHAHTTGDIFVWLPKERVIFTGDAAVNGPYNYTGDADTASWIEVMARAQALEPQIVVPGHGPVGKADVLQLQKQYFIDLRAQVGAMVREGKPLEEVQAAVDVPGWKRWTGETKMKPENVGHVYEELTRGPLTWVGGDPKRNNPVVAIPIPNDGQRPKLKFMTGPVAPEVVAGLRQVAPNVELVVVKDAKEALARAPEADAMDGSLCTPAVLPAAKKLRWVQQFSAGVEQLIAIPELVANDKVVLTNMRAMFGPNIADHVFALLLSLTRGLPHYQQLMQTETWEKRGNAGIQLLELKDKTMLIVGLGGIGREVAVRAHAFGMQVVATDAKEMALPPYVSRLEPPQALKSMLPLADVVVIAAPLTGKTTGLIGPAELALMKPSAFYINVARGKIQDNQALAAALKAGKLAGAGLDVTEPEPLPKGHPLWKAPHVIITPHVAGQSPGSVARRRALFTENMRRFAAGEPLLNVVDKKAGY